MYNTSENEIISVISFQDACLKKIDNKPHLKNYCKVKFCMPKVRFHTDRGCGGEGLCTSSPINSSPTNDCILTPQHPLNPVIHFYLLF